MLNFSKSVDVNEKRFSKFDKLAISATKSSLVAEYLIWLFENVSSFG